MKVVGCVLDYLHGIDNLKIFTNGRMTPKVITTTSVVTITKSTCKSCFKFLWKIRHKIFSRCLHLQYLVLGIECFIPPTILPSLVPFLIRLLFVGHVSNLWPSPNMTWFHYTFNIGPCLQDVWYVIYLMEWAITYIAAILILAIWSYWTPPSLAMWMRWCHGRIFYCVREYSFTS